MVVAMYAQVAPTVLAHHQRRPKLIAEAERLHDLAGSKARRAVASASAIECRDVLPRSGQRREFVNIVVAELVGKEHWSRHAKRLLGIRSGKKQCLGICGGEERGIYGHQSTK